MSSLSEKGSPEALSLRPSGEALDAPEVIEPSLVVAIGASAGGLEALQQFFAHVPLDERIAYVVVQHLAPDFRSVMAEILGRHTRLPIDVAEHGMALQGDHVYLIPPATEMMVAGARLLLADREPGGMSYPINTFMKSLANEYGSRAVGVVLSGTGHDGTRGCQAIHDAGGHVLCQSPETAVFDGMPRSVIDAGIADAVLSPDRLSTSLWMSIEDRARDDGADEADPVFAPVFKLLGDRFGVHFDLYRTGTIARRVERRMAMRRVDTVEHYVRLLQAEPDEQQDLFESLLIGVTDFFRDPPVWEAVDQQVLTRLYDDHDPDREVRIWVAGTAGGQEAYSVAMLAHEVARRSGRPPQVRVFATDIHAGLIDDAARGIYTSEQCRSIPADLRSRYFTELDRDRFLVSPELRKSVVFARHDVTKDVPFMKLDLVTCRNLLIYLQPAAQRRVLSLLLFALRRDGALVLGSSEGLGPLKEEVEVLDSRRKIFRKRREMRYPVMLPGTVIRMRDGNAGRAVQTGARESWLIRAYDSLLAEYAPSAVLVDASGAVVHVFGDATRWLTTPVGRATNQLVRLVRDDLQVAVATALHRVEVTGEASAYGGLKTRDAAGHEAVLRITARLLEAGRRDNGYLVLFEEARPIPSADDSDGLRRGEESGIDAAAAVVAPEEQVRYLQTELRYAEERVQAAVEEVEATNEELQASNEELIAANEELQSTNEELHSVNEELYSVNREYEESNDRLGAIAADLDNLMRCTDIGIVIIDDQLRIRRFTPAAMHHINLLPADVGRPLVHLNRDVEVEELDDKLRRVLETASAYQEEVRHLDGGWFLMRLHPLRAEGSGVSGVVITFVDTTALREARHDVARRSRELQDLAYAVSHDMQEPLRMVISFAELFERRYRSLVSDPDGGQFLDEVRAGGRRLQSMLAALLLFSRVETRAAPLRPVDLGEVLATELHRASAPLQACGARIDLQPGLPMVMADPEQLGRAIQELIKNSLAAVPGGRGRVTVTAQAVGEGMVQLCVRDNGPGIPPADRERVFVMFQRGHHASPDDESVGVGLTLVQRIAERHGGYAEIQEGAPGEGACVAITLMAAPLKPNTDSGAAGLPEGGPR